MSSKRKADLQRRLSLRSVPPPPDELLDRIKADIPRYLNVEAERARFSRSIGFHLKVAASVLIAITSLLGVMFLYTGDMAEKGAPVAAITEYPQSARAAAPSTTAALETVQVEIAQEASPVARVAQVADATSTTTTLAAEPQAQMTHNYYADGVEELREEAAPAAVAAPPPPPAAVAEAMPPQHAEVFAAPVPPPPQPVAATAAAAPQQRALSMSTDLVTPAQAAKLELAPKSVFGLSIDPDAFRRIKNTIEHGGKPSPANVDIEALVNYFAGAPARRVRRGNGVRMEVEASPAPVESPGNRGILRITIDTAELRVAEGASVPPIARDAKLEIEFNSDAVRQLEPIGDHVSNNPENALLHNLSVTGLYALDLKDTLRARDTVATIRLRYRSVSDGKPHTITRVVYGSEFAKQWSNATRRHRLASLGALWGESLRSTRGGTDVAKRAQELASQEPKDERAQELAAVTKESGDSR